MDTGHAVVLLVSLGLLVVAAALVFASPVIIGGDGEGAVQETRLAGFETSDPYCLDDPNVTNGTAESEDIPGGEQLVVNRTVPVDGPDSEVRAELDTWGSGHHTLAITTEPGNETGDCPHVVRYNATVEFSRPDDWTLLITYDGELVGGHWRDDGTGGSFEETPSQPIETPDNGTAGNGTSENASAGNETVTPDTDTEAAVAVRSGLGIG